MQMDYTFMSGEGEACDESRAQVVILTVVGVDDGAVATTALRSKTDEHGVRLGRGRFEDGP